MPPGVRDMPVTGKVGAGEELKERSVARTPRESPTQGDSEDDQCMTRRFLKFAATSISLRRPA